MTNPHAMPAADSLAEIELQERAARTVGILLPRCSAPLSALAGRIDGLVNVVAPAPARGAPVPRILRADR